MRNDYLSVNQSTLDQDVAVQLCCLEIRYFFKDMPQVALDKKSNLEYLEREVSLFFFFFSLLILHYDQKKKFILSDVIL